MRCPQAVPAQQLQISCQHNNLLVPLSGTWETLLFPGVYLWDGWVRLASASFNPKSDPHLHPSDHLADRELSELCCSHLGILQVHPSADELQVKNRTKPSVLFPTGCVHSSNVLSHLCQEIKSSSNRAQSRDLLLPSSTSHCPTGTQKFLLATVKPDFGLTKRTPIGVWKSLRNLTSCPLLKPGSPNPYNSCPLKGCHRSQRLLWKFYIKPVPGVVVLLDVVPCHRRAGH